MRYILPALIMLAAIVPTGCNVKVEEKPAPIIKRDRDVDIKIDAPGVDVKVKKD